jgi:hypothetical protein
VEEKERNGCKPDIGMVDWNIQGGGGIADRMYVRESWSLYINMAESVGILLCGEFREKYIVERKDKGDVNLTISGGIER